MTLQQLRTLLTILQIGAHVLLFTKLLRTHLLRKYQYLGWYIGFELLRLVSLSFFTFKSKTYAHFYFVTQPISWVLFVLIVLDLFQKVLSNHQGIATLGRRGLSVSLGLSAAVSGMTLLVDLRHSASESAILFNFMLLERLVMTSLLMLTLCLTAFLAYFPVPLARNVQVHTCILTAYFAVKTSMLWVRTIYGLQPTPVLNAMLQALAIACLLCWTFLLTPGGEAPPPRSGPKSGSEERLLAQLDALNETLLGSARK